MPIRSFQLYSTQKELPISDLDNTILAIEGFWFLRKYLVISNGDQFNNYSQLLKECLDPIVKMSQKVSIVWIWDGLEFRQPPSTSIEKINLNCQRICKSGNFNKSLIDQELFVDLATPYLRENGITVIRSPYSATAQCAYYLKESCVNYIFAKLDAVLFEDCDRIITEFDFLKFSFQIFERNSFFKENNLELESLRRLAFVSGCEYCPTHPFYANSFDFFEMLEMIKSNTTISLFDSMNTVNEDFQRYKNEYQQAFFIVDYSPVMYLDGIVRPISNLPVPSDLDKIFGERQSDFIYSQIFTCSIGIKILSATMFQKQNCFYKKNLCSAFKAVLETKPSEVTLKSEDIYDFLAKKLEVKITWHDSIYKIVQLVFMSLVDCDFDANSLLKLLNVGTKDIKLTDDSSFEKNYTPENLKYFYLFNEVFILYKDLCKLAKAMFKFEQSFEFDLSYEKISCKEINSEIKQFVMNNCKNAIRMKEILALLENK